MEINKSFTARGDVQGWLQYKLGDLISFKGGSQPPRFTFIFTPKEGYVRLLQIRDYKSDKYATYIPVNLAKNSCSPDDIMIGRYGPPIFQILKGLSGAYNVALIKAEPNSKLSKTYAYYFLTQDKLFEFVDNLSQRSSGQTGIDLKELKNYPFPLPPTLEEQTAIATTLYDTDALITSLEKLIIKKHNIKQGAMRQLLKPKTGWNIKQLGDVSEIYTGKKNNQDKVEGGAYPFFVRSQIIERINTYSYDGEAILVPGEGSIGNTYHYINGRFDFHQRVYKISDFRENYSGKYIYRYMCENFGKYAMQNSVKATVDSLRLPTFQNFEIPFPPTLEEQIQLANILSDMDSEIALLKSKLQKYRQIKTGMMQNLLTGKIRLV